MTQHFIQTHKGEDHISSDDARSQWACLLGKGRAIAAGWEEEMALSVPSNNTLHIGCGYALIDGGWYRISGSGEDISIPPGSIGMNRRDAVFLAYTRGADDVESMTHWYVTGNPTTGTPTAPTNEHPGNILSGDATVWILLGEVPISGLTVGKPVLMLGKRALSPPAQQCAECSSIMTQITQALADVRSAEAQAVETVRANEAILTEINKKQNEWSKKMERLDEYEAELSDFAQILADQIGNYMILGHKLIAPSAWVEYDHETHSVKLRYAEQDGTKVSLTKAPTVASQQEATQEQTDINTADIDFLMMLQEKPESDEEEVSDEEA